MKVIAVVQLDRLIAKLGKLDSNTVIETLKQQISLLKQCHNIDEWVYMADLNNSACVPPQLQGELGIKLTTSLQSDPLDEFYHAASASGDSINSGLFEPLVVRIVLGQRNPEPVVIAGMVENHTQRGYDYSRSEAIDDGMSAFIEVMNFAALDEAWREALLPDDRENITPYIYRQHQRLNVGTYRDREAFHRLPM